MSGPARAGAVLPPSAFRRLSTELDQVATYDDARRSASLPFVNGRAIDFVFTASPSSAKIDHKLGRAPTGWIVTRIVGGVSATEELASDTLTLTLQHTGGASVTVSVWVY